MFYTDIPYIYFVPVFHEQNIQILNNTQGFEDQYSEHKTQIFIQRFIAQLQLKHQNSYIKEWTPEQDELLLKLGSNCSNWQSLSKKFKGKSAKICKRRYFRLLKIQKEWPKEDQQLIKNLKKNKKTNWLQIQRILQSKNPQNKNYTAKKLREKFTNCINREINRNKWTIQQDIYLWKLCEEQRKNWKKICQIMPSRNSIQIRNRYYKFIQPLVNQIRSKLQSSCKIEETQPSIQK